MPPTCVIAAEYDVLTDDSRRLAAALTRDGVRNELFVQPGVTHAFINRGRLVPVADACLARSARFLATAGRDHRAR